MYCFEWHAATLGDHCRVIGQTVYSSLSAPTVMRDHHVSRYGLGDPARSRLARSTASSPHPGRSRSRNRSHHLTGHDRGLQVVIGQRPHIRADGLVQYLAHRVQRGHHRVTDRVSDELSMNSRIEAATDKPAHCEIVTENVETTPKNTRDCGKAEELTDLFERVE
jgi:hypothetical protein